MHANTKRHTHKHTHTPKNPTSHIHKRKRNIHTQVVNRSECRHIGSRLNTIKKNSYSYTNRHKHTKVITKQTRSKTETNMQKTQNVCIQTHKQRNIHKQEWPHKNTLTITFNYKHTQEMIATNTKNTITNQRIQRLKPDPR